MSDKDEMIEISVPVAWAEMMRKLGRNDGGPCFISEPNQAVSLACKAALDARKSPYDRWRESITGTVTVGDAGYLTGAGWQQCNPAERKLIKSVLQLLDALINSVKCCCCGQDSSGRQGCKETAHDAIRAAMPDDVAEYVIGEAE